MAENKPPEEYPGHTRAFVRIMAAVGIHPNDGKILVDRLEPQVRDVMAITDEELVLLRRLPTIDPSQDASRRLATADIALDAEIARRIVDTLRLNREAIIQSTTAIQQLRTATERWSAWLTRLTIGIFGLTFLLFVLAVAQVINGHR